MALATVLYSNWQTSNWAGASAWINLITSRAYLVPKSENFKSCGENSPLIEEDITFDAESEIFLVFIDNFFQWIWQLDYLERIRDKIDQLVALKE